MKTATPLTICPPSVRVVVLASYQQPEPPFTTVDVHHVLAVASWVGPDGYARHDVLIVEPDAAWPMIVTATEAFEGVKGVDYRLVTCPWGPSEDAERLAPVIAEMTRPTPHEFKREIKAPPHLTAGV